MRLSHIVHLGVLMSIALIICFTGEMEAQDAPSSGNFDQFILMRNGNVKQGNVYPAEEQGYSRITTPDYSIRIPSHEVVFAGSSLREVYLFRQSKIGTVARTREDASRFAQERGYLAEWCIRYGLNNEAMLEISRGKILDEDNRHLLLSEQRILRRLEDPRVTHASVEQEATPLPLEAQATDVFTPTFPLLEIPTLGETPNAPEIIAPPIHWPPSPAPAASDPVGTAPPAAASNPDSAEPTWEELDAIVRDMPGDSMRTFTRTVQPLLINSCGTVDCHGPGADQAFQVAPPQAGLEVNRRLSQRNLYATLRWIDRKHPTQSPLLLKPITVHGGLVEPVFTSKEAARHRDLTLWAFQIARYGNSLSPLSQITYRQPDREFQAAAPTGPQMMPSGMPLVAPESLYSPYGDGRPQSPSVAWVVPPTGPLIDSGATVPTPVERMRRGNEPSAAALRMSQGPRQGTPGQLFTPPQSQNQTPSWLNSTNNPYSREEGEDSSQTPTGPQDPLDPSRFNGQYGPTPANPSARGYPESR